MDHTASVDAEQFDHDLPSSLPSSDDDAGRLRKAKKRRRPPRQNRKPARPANYMGQRSNNRLRKI